MWKQLLLEATYVSCIVKPYLCKFVRSSLVLIAAIAKRLLHFALCKSSWASCDLVVKRRPETVWSVFANRKITLSSYWTQQVSHQYVFCFVQQVCLQLLQLCVFAIPWAAAARSVTDCSASFVKLLRFHHLCSQCTALWTTYTAYYLG